MNERLREWATTAAAALRRLPWRGMVKPLLLFLASAMLGLWFALPVEALVTRVVRSEGLAKSPWRLNIESAHMGLLGPVLQGLSVSGPTQMHITELTLRPRASTLWLRPGVAFRIADDRGRLKGHAGMAGDNRDLDLTLDAVDMAVLGLDKLPLGITASGNLGGRLSLAAPKDALNRVTGSVDLVLSSVVLRLPEGLMPVSDIVVPRLEIAAIANDGALEFDAVRIDGEDISGTIRGTIRLAPVVLNSSTKLEFRLRLGPRLVDGLAPLLPLAGFRKERDLWVRSFQGPLSKLLGS